MTTETKRTTGIGSLPHHNVDAALKFSFSLEIPFLPQIPLRNPWEYMLPQALEGLPGLIVEQSGVPILDVAVWTGRAKSFGERLKAAFSSKDPFAFEGFEPTSATCACYQPFLFELEEQKRTSAKVQIAGPLTCQWGLKTIGKQDPEIFSQIFKLTLARSIAMVRRLKFIGIEQPILFLDEPALFSVDLPALMELRIFIESLKKEGAIVGLHCCSETPWEPILNLGLDCISLDTGLSIASLINLKGGEPLTKFIKNGGRLALGLVPTHSKTEPISAMDAHDLFERFVKTPNLSNELLQLILRDSWITPACGLALHSTFEAENVLALLKDLSGDLRRAIKA